MSMSTHVIGFRPPDTKWKKMKAIWDVCESGGVEPPMDVLDFFNGEEPDERGVQIELEGGTSDSCVQEWNDGDMCSGFEIDVTKLPKDVIIIRFWNSF